MITRYFRGWKTFLNAGGVMLSALGPTWIIYWAFQPETKHLALVLYVLLVMPIFVDAVAESIQTYAPVPNDKAD